MKMIYRLLFFCFIFLFSSCFTDGLEEDTSGILGTDSFYKTEADLDAALMAVYQGLFNAFRNNQGQLALYGGDDLTTIPGSNKTEFRQWDRFDYSSNSAWLNTFVYKPYWDIIYRANAVINNIDNISEIVDPEEKEKAEGQAKFLRGFSYFQLVRVFGGVPIITDQANGDETRSSVLEVYKLVESDLKDAAENLPESWGKPTGRITSGAARTALADLYLTWAGWPVKDESKYSLAAEVAKEVMESGVYSLLDNYGDLWQPDADFNGEDIFDVVFNNDAGINQTMAIGSSVADESGWIDAQAELTLFNRMPSGPRKDATYYTEFVHAKGGAIHWTESQYKLPTFKKWQDGGTPGPSSPYEYGERNIPVYRYAEVLLTFAEANAMANGAPSEEDYDAVNLERQRSEEHTSEL